MKTVPVKYLPPRFPIWNSLILVLSASYWNAPEWAWSLIITVIVLMWVAWIIWLVKSEEIKQPPFDKE